MSSPKTPRVFRVIRKSNYVNVPEYTIYDGWQECHTYKSRVKAIYAAKRLAKIYGGEVQIHAV